MRDIIVMQHTVVGFGSPFSLYVFLFSDSPSKELLRFWNVSFAFDEQGHYHVKTAMLGE